MTRNLFDELPGPESGSPEEVSADAPLADRIRPRSLDEVLGQEEVVGPDGFLRTAIAEDRVPSLVFWGPPGSGKTTLARILARETESRFVPFSAVTSGIKEVREIMKESARLRRHQGRGTILFVDEIHRFNRAQQDAFLPYVESGEITLVGATTENPSFELNSALLSRCRVVVLNRLSTEELETVVDRALEDPERGLGCVDVVLQSEARAEIAQRASGDARRALNLLELVVRDAVSRDRDRVEASDVARVAQGKTLVYDKSGEEHFNLISALHKSLRESDPDAAAYWLGRMLAGGEDPLYVARRMVRFASEDVGLADPRALTQALAAWDAYHRLGSPEGDLALYQAAVYLALAPKSDAVYRAQTGIRRTIEERPADPVPMSLRNAPTRLMEEVGYGEGYVHAHGEENAVGGIQCLPDSLAGTRFYEPTERGFEEELRRRLEWLEDVRKTRSEADDRS